MTSDDDIRVRPGRIRSTSTPRAKSFLAQALQSAQRAGGLSRGGARSGGSFGRGRAASLAATRLLQNRGRNVMIKARVVRQMRSPGTLRAHIGYLQRDGVTRDGAPGKLFDIEGDDADGRAFAERCEGDRHHFRFIVSPDDATDIGSLRTFTRELMDQASRDLATRLDWVAVDHWNTEHPHIHILVRGRADDGSDLVISRDYISVGLRARAGDLVTRELGLRSEVEVRRGLEAEIGAERWTRLDRVLTREAGRAEGVVDLRPDRNGGAHDPLREIRIGRMRTLERLGIAEPAGPARWVLAGDAEPRLRALGERGDIIKRLHKSLAKDGAARSPATWALEGERHGEPVIGRLVARGLDDELRASAFAVVDGIDGRVHHLKLADIDAAGDSPIGGIVELRRFEDARGRQRIALAVRSDLNLDQQVAAEGATWLDRRLASREGTDLSRAGFGAEVRDALNRRIDALIERDLARRDGDKVTLGRNLIGTLRDRELDAMGRRLASETGLSQLPAGAGEPVSGIYRRRLSLASGRFAMIDNGLGFQLVPWVPSLERELGRQVNGIAGPGGVDWSLGRRRDLSL